MFPATEEDAVKQYENLVFRIAHKFKPQERDFDDYIQHGFIALIRAWRTFKPGRKVKFITYAYVCIVRELISLQKTFKKQQGVPSSLLEQNEVEGNCGDDMWEFLPNNLSPAELKTLRLKADGHTFSQIGEILGGLSRGWANKLYKQAIVKIREAHAKT